MSARTPQEQRNLDLVLALFDEVLNPLDAEAVDRFLGEDYIQHSALAGGGREGLKAFLRQAKAETPLAVHDVKRCFTDGDHVVVHYHVRRTPDDTGFAVMDIFRIADGRIAEHWDVIQAVPGNAPNFMF